MSTSLPGGGGACALSLLGLGPRRGRVGEVLALLGDGDPVGLRPGTPAPPWSFGDGGTAAGGTSPTCTPLRNVFVVADRERRGRHLRRRG